MHQVWLMRSSTFETKSLYSRNSYVGHSILNHGSNHPLRRRGGQFGHEKRQRTFSRTGRRAAGMLLVANQFHDLFECLFVCDWAQKKFRDLLIRMSLPANSTVCRTCLAPAGELSSRRVFNFSVKISPQHLHCQFHCIDNWSLTREIRNFFKIPLCWICVLVAWYIVALA